LRHAKAVPSSGSLSDFDRPLHDQGKAQAGRLGTLFKEKNPGLDLVLSSNARRARETTELFLAASQFVIEVRYEPRIYEASRHQLLEVLAALEPDLSSVMLVGHNPGLEELLQHLTGRFQSMITATLVKLDLTSANGTEPLDLRATLDWLVTPN
jgi:phosphohistidine phosphatase